MDGLDCKEVMMSVVKENSDFFRLDSHCFEKRFDLLKQTLKYVHYKRLFELVSKPIQTGHTPSMSNVENYGGNIAFIKTDNLHSNDISDMYNDYLSDKGNAEIFRTFLQPKDIITTIIGATEDVIARSAMIQPAHLPANINQNIVQIRINSNIICPEYINTYLNTKYGRYYLIYLSRQTEQVNLNCQEVGNVLIPIFKDEFHSTIKAISSKAYDLQMRAKTAHSFAENQLNKYLNVPNCSKDVITQKTLSNSLMQSGRLDAEYYQPKYDIYEQAIKRYTNGFTVIKDKFELVTEKCLRDLMQYKYIEIGDINVGNGSYTYTVLNTEDLPDNAKIMTRAGDILVSTVRPNRGAVAILEEDDLLVSGAFTVLRPKSGYSKEILQVLLRTPIYRDCLLKFNVGTSYPVIKDNDILNMPIPLLDESIQKEISDKVQESFRLRKEAKQLLDKAIKAVEIAIETNEETALKQLCD